MMLNSSSFDGCYLFGNDVTYLGVEGDSLNGFNFNLSLPIAFPYKMVHLLLMSVHQIIVHVFLMANLLRN